MAPEHKLKGLESRPHLPEALWKEPLGLWEGVQKPLSPSRMVGARSVQEHYGNMRRGPGALGDPEDSESRASAPGKTLEVTIQW